MKADNDFKILPEINSKEATNYNESERKNYVETNTQKDKDTSPMDSEKQNYSSFLSYMNNNGANFPKIDIIIYNHDYRGLVAKQKIMAG